MKRIDEEGVTWCGRGFCDVEGRIESEPSKITRVFKIFSVYSKSGIRLGIIDPITEEDRKVLESIDGKYVRFRSYPPSYTVSDRIFHLHLRS